MAILPVLATRHTSFGLCSQTFGFIKSLVKSTTPMPISLNLPSEVTGSMIGSSFDVRSLPPVVFMGLVSFEGRGLFRRKSWSAMVWRSLFDKLSVIDDLPTRHALWVRSRGT